MAAQDLNAMAFPKLTEEQIRQLARYAGTSTKIFRAGEALFHAGDRDPKFFVIKSGEVEIIDITGDQPKTIRVQGPGDFTGDVGHLTGSPKVVSAIARSDCEVYRNVGDRTAESFESGSAAERSYSASVHRAPAIDAGIARVYRIARDRFSLFARHLSDPRFSGEKSRALYLVGFGRRSGGERNCSNNSE